MRERIAAYCRVSTASEEQMASLREQESFFSDYAKEHGLTLVRIYADGGRSGTRLANRPAFGEMMADARRGAFEILLVKDISRMARNVLDFLQTVRTLKQWGIDCRFLTANCSLADGEMLLTILAAVAQEESANLSKRVKFTKAHHARQGRVPNSVYGYRREKGELFSLTIDEAESEVVRRIYEYALDGWRSRRIARLLRAEGHLTKAGNLFGESSVRQILANSLYAGILRTHQTEVVDYLTGRRRVVPSEEQYTFLRPELAIVSEDTWHAVQKKRGAPRERGEAIGGEIVCAVCQKPFRRRRQGGDTILSCSKRSRLGKDTCCNRVRVSERELTESLGAWLAAYMTEARWQKAIKEAHKLSAATAENWRLRDRLCAKQETLLMAGVIERAEYLRRVVLIDEETNCSDGLASDGDSREAILRYMVSKEGRGRWLERVIVDTDGKITAVVRRTRLRRPSMLPAWEIL